LVGPKTDRGLRYLDIRRSRARSFLIAAALSVQTIFMVVSRFSRTSSRLHGLGGSRSTRPAALPAQPNMPASTTDRVRFLSLVFSGSAPPSQGSYRYSLPALL
jgi:hypothetical protein